MEILQIREDVWEFRGASSAYLIKNDDASNGMTSDGPEWILIDAGSPDDVEDLKREIPKVVSLKKINIVLLTHLHYDHIAGLELFSNAKVFASGEELQDYVENARGFNFYVNSGIDKILREKAKMLKGSGWGLKMLRVPGHTRGSVAFLDEKRKILFSGDTIFGEGMMGRYDFANSVPDKIDGNVRMLYGLVEEKGLTICSGHDY